MKSSRESHLWAAWGSDHELSIAVPLRRRDHAYVYVAWGSDRSRPLYVGKSRNIWDRIGHHLVNKDWADDVLEWECHGFPTERNAELAELEAIHELNPIHNVMRGTPRSVIARNWAEATA